MTAVWVTGARGFIGRHLARHLAAGGADVAGIGHGQWDAGAWGIGRWVDGRVNGASLDALADAAGLPEVVYHAAGGASVGRSFDDPRGDFERTVVSTAELLEWLRLRAPRSRLVVISSAAVYGDRHPGRIQEDAPLAPYSPYGAHKLAMEHLCRGYGQAFGLSAVVARLFSVYGPELSKQLLWDLCGRLEAGAQTLVLGGTGDELRDWTHVEDVARALEDIAGFAAPDVPVVNLGSGNPVSVREIAGVVGEGFGIPSEAISFSGVKRAGDPFSLVADPSRLAARGFEWRTAPAEGIADYVRWYRARAKGSDA